MASTGSVSRQKASSRNVYHTRVRGLQSRRATELRSALARYVYPARHVGCNGLAQAWWLVLVLWLAPVIALPVPPQSATKPAPAIGSCRGGPCGRLRASQASPPASSDSSGLNFVIRFKDGQVRFRQSEIITVELGYGANPQALAKRFPDHPDRPGVALDRFVLLPHTGVVDPLRDFLSTVGGWDGPPPRSVPFVEAGGSWATVDINEWFRFDKPGKYRLSVLAYPVRTRFEAYGNRPESANTVKSNTLEFEIVPAEEAWQDATLERALTLLAARSNDELQRQGCRMLRFLATPAAVDNMVEDYVGPLICATDFRDGLFAYPDRQYAVRKLEDGLLEPSVAVSAGYLDTLARLSACLQRPDLLPGKDDQDLGSSAWMAGGGGEGLWELIEEEQDRYVQELLGALDNKLNGPRALCLEAIFDSPFLGRPTLLKSNDSALVAKLRKEIAAHFLELPIFDQSMTLYNRWENIASPAMIPVLKRLYANPGPGSNDQFIAFVLNHLYQLDPAEGRALILAEMKRPHPRLDLRFVRLLPDKEIPELDDPLAENLEAGNGDEDTILQLIGRYATPAIFPRVLAAEETRIVHVPCEGQAAFLAYAFKSDSVRGAALLDECVTANNPCAATALARVLSRPMTPEIQRLAIMRLGDSYPPVAAAAATALGLYGSVETEQLLWDRMEKWHATWAGRANELPGGSGIPNENGLETTLEQSLIDALGAGQAWFAGPGELARLSRLCVSTVGCQKVNDIASQAEVIPNINVYGSEPDYHASVAQYQADSIDSLKQKLAQFPEGSTFTWSFGGEEKEGAAILADLRAFLKAHGMTINDSLNK